MLKQSLIIFNRDIDSYISFFGGKLLSKKDADKYLEIVENLSNSNAKFYIGAEEIPYSPDDFTTQEITTKEFEKFKNFIGFEFENDMFGIFPDALNDAIDYGIEDEIALEQYDEDEDAEYDDV